MPDSRSDLAAIRRLVLLGVLNLLDRKHRVRRHRPIPTDSGYQRVLGGATG